MFKMIVFNVGWQMGELAADKHVKYIISVEKVGLISHFLYILYFYRG